MIGDRMRQARLAAGLTLDEVAERLGHTITKAGLSKYERRKSVPDASFLVGLGRVLAVKAAYFLEDPEIEVEWLAYRKRSALTKTRQEQIKAHALRRIEAHLWLEAKLYPNRRPKFPNARPTKTLDEAEAAAGGLRKSWKLGDLPIESVTQTVEDRGGIVIAWQDDKRFDGLSGWANKRVPVVVGDFSCPADRRRYSVSHELGHLAMDCGGVDAKTQEQLAHRFAAAFLVSAETARRELGGRRRSLSLAELGLLKRKHGLSMQAWIRRACDLGIISESHYRQLNIAFRSRGWHKEEPVDFVGQEVPSRLRLMLFRAVSEGIVTKEWAEQVCPEGLDELPAPEAVAADMPRAVQLARQGLAEQRVALQGAANALARDYLDDEELSAFTVLDTEELHDYAEER